MKITKTAPKNWDFFNEHGASLGAYKVIGFIGQILSGLSLAYAVYALILAEVMKRSGEGNYTFPLIAMALLVGLFIELANRILARRAIKPIVKNGMFQDYDDLHHRHVVLNRSYMVGLVIVALTSYFLSGVGSSYYADDSSDAPTLIDVDSIKQAYDQKLAALETGFVRDTQLLTAPYVARIKAAENRFQSDSLALMKERERYRACAGAGNSWCKTKLTDHLAQIDRARATMNDSIGVISSQKATTLLTTLKGRNDKNDQLSKEKQSEVYLANQQNTSTTDSRQKSTGFKGIVFIIITFIGQTVFYLMVYLTLQVEAGSEIDYEVEPNELWNRPGVIAEFWTTLAWKSERGARHLIAKLFGEPRDSVVTKIPYRSLQEELKIDPATSTKGSSKSDDPFTAHESSGKDYALSDLKQRLADYQKRHARHLQKKIQLEKNKKPVNKRTLEAIDNNAKWVAHYTELIREKESQSS